jgi:hypothetical protein
LQIPLSITATAGFGDIQTLSATLVNPNSTQTAIALSTTGLGTSPSVTGTATLSLSTGGQYTINVSTYDGCNTSTSSTTFTINVVTIYPPPTAGVTLPGGSVYTRVDCGGPASVVVDFTGSSTALPISSLTATLDGSPITFAASGLGTEDATGTATLGVSTAGLHTIVVTATDSHGGTATATTTFTVNVTTAPPPAVSISSPVSGTSYTYSGSPLNIPLNFTATAAYGTITGVSATLDGAPITLTTHGLNSASVTGSATLNPTAICQHVVVVTATDSCGASVSATTDIVLKAPTKVCIQGCVFFDLKNDGCQDRCDPGICGATVKLCDSKLNCVATTTCASDGSYSFICAPGTYLVSCIADQGLTPTTNCQHGVTVNSGCVTVPCTGFFCNWSSLRCLTASGCTSGFWHSNICDAISCTSKGAQICGSKIQAYTCTIASGGIGCGYFSGLTESKACTILQNNCGNANQQLCAEVLAAEYNYLNGCYINNDQELTTLFICWGEYTLQNAGSCGTSTLQYAHDWFAAYNQTQGGGCVLGPG